MRRVVWNLGLPRTGTTSTTEALVKLDCRCNPVVAAHLAPVPWQFSFRLPPGPLPPLIASVRSLEEWVPSYVRYTRVTEQQALDVHGLYAEWLGLNQDHVHTFRPEEGYRGLLRALSLAVADHPNWRFPHLNQSGG